MKVNSGTRVRKFGVKLNSDITTMFHRLKIKNKLWINEFHVHCRMLIRKVATKCVFVALGHQINVKNMGQKV
jgi:hypothetical protein